MSVEKYAKHQRSKYPKFVATDPKTKEVIYSSDNEEDFMKERPKFKKKTSKNTNK